jgi:hypothetical protein
MDMRLFKNRSFQYDCFVKAELRQAVTAHTFSPVLIGRIKSVGIFSPIIVKNRSGISTSLMPHCYIYGRFAIFKARIESYRPSRLAIDARLQAIASTALIRQVN